MLKKSLMALVLSSMAVAASAHELWIERDGNGPVRVYVGHAEGHPDKGESVAKLEANTKVFTTDAKQLAKLAVKEDHLEATVATQGDARMVNDLVWNPWKTKEGGYQAAIFTARAGRTDTKAVLDFELVPVAANGNTFTLVYKGKPLAEADVNVISPEKWTKTFTTDSEGRITLPIKEKGRFILVGAHNVDADKGTEVAGQKVDKLSYTTALSFVAE